MSKRKPAHTNRWGAYICEPCSNGEHLGVLHVGLCQCTCDGAHDRKGNRTRSDRVR